MTPTLLKSLHRLIAGSRGGSSGGLFRKTVVFSCFITIVPIVFFISRILPAQQSIFMSNLEEQIRSLAASIDETSVSAIIAEDYTPVIELCQKVLYESPNLEYVVLTRKETGFSLVTRQDGWRQTTLSGSWTDVPEDRENDLIVRANPWAEGEILHLSYPIDYADWTWGWVHLGLSSEQFNLQIAAIRRRILTIALLSIIIGMVGSFFFSSRLTRPIRSLNSSIQSLASGNLRARAEISTGDEVQQLADAFNSMAESLEQSQRALTTAKNFNENIIRSSISMLIVISPEGYITFVNRSVVQLLGYAQDEIVGLPLDRILVEPVHPDDSQTPTTMAILTSRNAIHCLERTFRSKDGSTIPVLLSGSAMQIDGQVEALVCSALDITERKHAEIELEQLHRKIVDASHLAGMAEVANNVLHNVGNVLNSVNVSAAYLKEKANGSRTHSLSRVVSLIRDHREDLADFIANDPKGRKLLPYMESLAEHFDQEQQSVCHELNVLGEKIDHIKEIVSMQQNYSRLYGVRETVRLDALVEDAIRMNSAALTRHTVTLKRSYRACPEVTTDKHKILQVLVNLIRNAKYALDEGGDDDKLMNIVLDQDDTVARIQIIDNGVGMTDDTRSRLFEHGFTTRSNGHGFGLHGSHLAARELGGTLSGNSDGPGCGATFTLEIPLSTGDENHA